MVQHTTLLGLGSLLPMGNLFAVVSAKGDSAANEDGYRAWLRYEPLEASKRSEYRRLLGGIVVHGDSASIRVAAEELQRGLSGLLGQPVPNMKTLRRGSVLVGDSGSEFIRNTITPDTLNGLGIEGYVLKQVPVAGGGAIVIAGLTGRGTLYGVFHFLRLLQTHNFIDELDLKEIPSSPLRLVNHWDNLDKDRNTDGLPIGSTGEESGTKQSPDRLLRFHNSLWKWDELPERLSPRYRDYARLLASTYINGIVVNNVNTSKHGLTGWKLLTKPYIQKVAALADVFRSYGVRLYLAVGFDSPMLIDQLPNRRPSRRWCSAMVARKG
jgi:alpha-glucuronidase